MLPASLYTAVYHHAMLVVVIGFAFLYWTGRGHMKALAQLNQAAMVVIGACVVLFIGLRPVDGVFVDMTTYAYQYERMQAQAHESGSHDLLFYGLMRLCSMGLPVEGFFLVCTLIYVAPLMAAFWRVHRTWAFPAFLATLTAFSFWAYGVNGIRNGMAASVLILAFAFHDKPVVMFPLMASAWGLHGATVVPAVAFLIVQYVTRSEIWLGFWAACAATSFLAGDVGKKLLSLYNPISLEDRFDKYVLSSFDSGVFRGDFLAYSILPVVVTLFLATTRQARPHHLEVLGPCETTEGGPLLPRDGLKAQIDRRPRRWAGLLQADPLFARLVNTYILANALWVLAIYAEFSNRIAYLSWFMLPWILLYPFIPGKGFVHARLGLIGAMLCMHYMFTYIMVVVVYPERLGR